VASFSITLVFFVIGSEIEEFSLEKDWDDDPLYVALEAQVNVVRSLRLPDSLTLAAN